MIGPPCGTEALIIKGQRQIQNYNCIDEIHETDNKMYV